MAARARSVTPEPELEYRAIFEASSDGLVVNDAETGVVLEANPAFCRMHGYETMTGLHPSAFIDPASQPLFEHYVRVIRGGGEFRCRARDVRRDGTVFDVEVLGRGLTYRGTFALLGVVRDVTEHMRAYQDLEQRVVERTRDIERRQEVAEALAELLSVVNSNRTLDEILEAIVAQAAQLLGSDAEVLYLLDERDPNMLCLQASRNLPAGGESPSLARGTPIVGLAVERERPVVAVDLHTILARPVAATVEEQIRDRGAYLEVVRRGPASVGAPVQRGHRTMAEHFRSLLAVPLATRAMSHGSLMLAYRARHVPSDEQLELIAAFAGQAGLAIENARLHERAARLYEQAEQRRREADQRRRVAEALRDLLAVVNSGRPLDDILHTVLEQTVAFLGSETSAVYLLNQDNASLEVRAVQGINVAHLAGHIRVGTPATGLAARERRPVAFTDLRAAVRAASGPSARALFEEHSSYLNVARLGAPKDEGDARELKRLQSLAHHHAAVLAVPLLVDKLLRGTITLFYAEPREFSDDDVRLATAFADQAALAIENTALRSAAHERAREAEQRLLELQALYGADEALHRSLRLDRVLQTLVGVAVEILAADNAAVFVWDAGHDRLVVGASHGFAHDLARVSFGPGEGVIGHVVTTGEPRAVEDVQRDPRAIRRFADRAGIRAGLHMPITVGGEIFGVFTVGSKKTRTFTAAEQRLLLSLAQRAALAIENARVHEQSEQRRRELEALYEADQTLHRSLRLDDVLNALVDAAVGLLHGDGAVVWGPGPDPRQRRSVPLACRGVSPRYLRETSSINEEQEVRELWWGQASDILVVEDVASDPRLPVKQRAALQREGVRSLLNAHVRVADQVFGTFGIGFHKPHTFSDAEIRLCVALAQRAGLAIQNARLYEQAQQAAALEERQRLARELHDAVTQTLFSTALIAEVLPELWQLDPAEAEQRLAELRRLTRGALAEMRTLLVELRPGALSELPLPDLLRQLAEATAGRTRLEVSTIIRGAVHPLPATVQVALYRLVQESLNNIVKHARARQASVELEYLVGGSVCLRVTDDGCGFDPSVVPAGHLGLGIMRERAAAIDARFELESRPGAGTSVEIRWRQMGEVTHDGSQ